MRSSQGACKNQKLHIELIFFMVMKYRRCKFEVLWWQGERVKIYMYIFHYHFPKRVGIVEIHVISDSHIHCRNVLVLYLTILDQYWTIIKNMNKPLVIIKAIFKANNQNFQTTKEPYLLCNCDFQKNWKKSKIDCIIIF